MKKPVIRRISCATAALAAALTCQAAAQTFQDGRGPLISGQVQQVGHEISTFDDRPETRTIDVFGLPTARTIKLRLERMPGLTVASGNVVVVRDAGDNEVDRYTAEQLAAEHSIWTKLIRGAAARVEVI